MNSGVLLGIIPAVLLGIIAVAGWLVALWISYDSLKTIKECEELCDSLNEAWADDYDSMYALWRDYCARKGLKED